MLSKSKIITFAVVAAIVIPLLGTSIQIQAQVQQLPSQAAPQAQQAPPLQLPPGAIVIPPDQQHGPSVAQQQADIQAHQGQNMKNLGIILNTIKARLGNDNSTAHQAQVLKQMTAEGIINCPSPFTNPGHCFLTPKMTHVPGAPTPPIG